MIELLKEAFAQAERLPEEEQRALAEMLLEQIANEKRWEELLNDTDSYNSPFSLKRGI